jgi:hypothetical protein
MSLTQAFEIHNVPLRVETEFTFLAEGVADLLGWFSGTSPRDGEVLQMTYRNGATSTGLVANGPPLGGELVFSSSWDNVIDLTGRLGIRLDIYRCDGQLFFDYHRHGHLLLDQGKGILDGDLVDVADLHPAALTNFFFLLPLSKLLACRGLHMIHAAALERNGRGVMIPGLSGSGKTTSCVALMRAGYRCLSDDKPFLRENGSRIELLAFPERIDVTDRTISFFPELRAAPPGVLRTGYRKKQFHAEALYPGASAKAAQPALILFPRISGESKSRLEKLPKLAGLDALLPLVLVVLDREASAHKFELLARLVEEVECYRLHFGYDIQDLPRLVDPLLT